MNDSISIDEGWQEPLDSDQATLVKGEPSGATTTGEWLVNVADQVIVPMSKAEVVAGLRSLRISERSLVWRVGMHDWSPLSDVPQLRLAAGRIATPVELRLRPPPKPVRSAPQHEPPKPPNPAPSQPHHEPPKAHVEARRRNTLPFGFPVVRDSATIRQPTGLARAEAAVRPPPAQRIAPLQPVAAVPLPERAAPRPAALAEFDALAVYERPTAELTFSDSVRAEWQGSANLVRQPAARTPSPAPAPAPVRVAAMGVDPPFRPSSVPPSSLAPTTSEPAQALPLRGAGLWGDLSVVLASDFRAVRANSKRLTWIASVGSAALASVLTFWALHSPQPAVPFNGGPTAAQPILPPRARELPRPVAVEAATTVPTTAPASISSAPVPARPKVSASPTPRIAEHAKPVATGVPQASFAPLDQNPYDDPSPPSKASPAPETEVPSTATPAAASGAAAVPVPVVPAKPLAPAMGSGLEDGPSHFHTPSAATPGF